MIILQLKFNDGREEFLSVDNLEFNTNTGAMIVGTDGVRYGIGTNCFAYVWIGEQVVKEYAVVGQNPNAPK